MLAVPSSRTNGAVFDTTEFPSHGRTPAPLSPLERQGSLPNGRDYRPGPRQRIEPDGRR